MDFVESSVHDKKEEFKDKYEFIRGLWNDPIGTLNHEKTKQFKRCMICETFCLTGI